jgi:hypothetical protein
MAGDRLTDGCTVRVTDRDDKHLNKLATVTKHPASKSPVLFELRFMDGSMAEKLYDRDQLVRIHGEERE